MSQYRIKPLVIEIKSALLISNYCSLITNQCLCKHRLIIDLICKLFFLKLFGNCLHLKHSPWVRTPFLLAIKSKSNREHWLGGCNRFARNRFFKLTIIGTEHKILDLVTIFPICWSVCPLITVISMTITTDRTDRNTYYFFLIIKLIGRQKRLKQN